MSQQLKESCDLAFDWPFFCGLSDMQQFLKCEKCACVRPSDTAQ